MNEYLVALTLDEGGLEQQLHYRIRASNREHALVYAGSIMGLYGNTPENTVVTSVETKLMRRL